MNERSRTLVPAADCWFIIMAQAYQLGDPSVKPQSRLDLSSTGTPLLRESSSYDRGVAVGIPVSRMSATGTGPIAFCSAIGPIRYLAWYRISIPSSVHSHSLPSVVRETEPATAVPPPSKW